MTQRCVKCVFMMYYTLILDADKYSAMPTVAYTYIIIDDALHLLIGEVRVLWNTNISNTVCNVNCTGGV